MEYKAVVFDMDGLMFDTENLWISACMATGKIMGYDISRELAVSVIGTSASGTRARFKDFFGDDFVFDDFYEMSHKMIDDAIYSEGIGVKKGLYELLDYLFSKGYKVAIASSSKMKVIEDYLSLAGIDKSLFSAIVSGENFKDSKPNPEIFLKTCELLGVCSSEVLVLEDSNNGIKAAYNAGCVSILIPDVDVIRNDTLRCANYKFESLFDVIDFLEG